ARPSQSSYILPRAAAATPALSLHDALPICQPAAGLGWAGPPVIYTPPPVTQRITQLLGGIENYAAEELRDALRDGRRCVDDGRTDRKSTRLNSSHVKTSYAVFCLKKTTRHL